MSKNERLSDLQALSLHSLASRLAAAAHNVRLAATGNRDAIDWLSYNVNQHGDAFPFGPVASSAINALFDDEPREE